LQAPCGLNPDFPAADATWAITLPQPRGAPFRVALRRSRPHHRRVITAHDADSLAEAASLRIERDLNKSTQRGKRGSAVRAASSNKTPKYGP
jgi:hypothetical protein